MKYYLIMVEGAHDVAVVERILKLNGVNQRCQMKSQVPEIWKRLIPDKYPFDGDTLERISQMPSIMMNDEISVAIQVAHSDEQLVPGLEKICSTLKIGEKTQITKILLICDADAKTAEEKKKTILAKVKAKADFKICQGDEMRVELDELEPGKPITIPLEMYVFPNNCIEGTLEDILLNAAGVTYSDLLVLARQYIGEIDRNKYTELKNSSKEKKAIIGCICNVLKPGKANQVAISDEGWIVEETLGCDGVTQLNEVIREFIC